MTFKGMMWHNIYRFSIYSSRFRSDKKEIIGEDSFLVEENLDDTNPEENPRHFVAILVKSLCLLEKLPFAVNVIIPISNIFFYAIINKFLGNNARNAAIFNAYSRKNYAICKRICRWNRS